MLGAVFQGSGQGQAGVAVELGQRVNGAEGQAAFGEGAGLVEDHRVDLVQAFQHMAAGQQQAELVQAAGGGGQGGGGGQRQGARASGDQQREHDPEGAVGIDLPPDDADDGGGGEDDQQEPLGDLVGQLGQARLVGLGAFQQADDGGQPGIVAQGLDFDGQWPFDVQRAGGDGIAFATRVRQVFAGEQGFVDAGLAFDDAAIGRQQGPRRHQDTVADPQLAEQDALAMACGVQAQAGGWQQVDQLCRGGGGALAGAAFQVAAGQEEEGEHAHSVEVELADPGDCGPDTGDISAANGQGDRDVHGQVPGAQVAQGAAEELAAAVEDDRGGEEQADPAQDGVELRRQVDVELRPSGHGGHHHLHPQQAGDAQLAHGAAVFGGQALGGFVGLVGVAGVADLAQFLEQLAERKRAVGPAHLQAVVGQVEAGVGHPRQGAQVLLDQPAAGGAADAFDQQAGLAQFTLVLDEGLLDFGAVVEGEFVRQFTGQGIGVGGGVAAVAVVALEAACDYGLGHRLAARTAHGPRLSQHAGLEAAAVWYRQAAVIAGKRDGHGRRLFAEADHIALGQGLFLEQAPVLTQFLTNQLDEATASDRVLQLAAVVTVGLGL
ncbi:hypothetical protein D3C84_398350 [compost metagenome]